MDLVAVTAGAPNLVVDTYGALTFWQRVQEKTRSKDLVEWVASLTANNYDMNGVGKPGTKAEAWGSENHGVGATGGAKEVTLGVQHLPPHNHTTNAGGSRGNTLGKASNDQGGALDFPTKNTGGGQSVSIVLEYISLLARQWVGF